MNTTEYLQTWSDSYKNDMISNISHFEATRDERYL